MNKILDDRQSARAVAYGPDGKVAILHVKDRNYHKLPGGGIEEGEDEMKGLKRELTEEVGEVEILESKYLGKLKIVVEKWGINLFSDCYKVKISKPISGPTFTKDEYDFYLEWYPLEEAIEKVKNDKTDDYGGKIFQVRDLFILTHQEGWEGTKVFGAPPEN